VLSESAFSVLVPVLEHVLQWRAGKIRSFFESHGLALDTWEKARTDRILVNPGPVTS
jgi:uncharacterized protein (DUF2384 family)